MDLANLSHNEFIKYIADNSNNKKAWDEFLKRYHKTIAGAVAKKVGGSKHYQRLDDIVQNVYLILLKNDCRALRNFKGEYENAIFSYLRMISVREAIKQMKAVPPEDPIDPNEMTGGSLRPLDETIEEIEYCLEKLTKRSRHPERDKLLFRLRYFDELERDEIVNYLKDNKDELSYKRISSVLVDLEKGMRECLEKRL